jgi:hypothetical protein
MMKPSCALLLCVLPFAACAHATPSGMSDEGARVEVGKGDPPSGMVELGAFEAADPLACEPDHKAGSEEAALAALRNQAGQLHADYVQIFRTDTDSCNRVVIRAMAFKRAAN